MKRDGQIRSLPSFRFKSAEDTTADRALRPATRRSFRV
jgi:hypothetical protein